VNFNSWTAGAAWAIDSSRFRGHYTSGAETVRQLSLLNSLDLSTSVPGQVVVSWDQWEGGTLESDDGLDFAVSADHGATWSATMQAFRDDIGGSTQRFNYVIPAPYLTSGFRMRFYLTSLSGSGEYAYVDNITVSVMPPDDSVIFRIDGQQVYLDANGGPQQGTSELTASRTQVLPNAAGINGFSYSAYRDVTQLVRSFSAKAPDPAINRPGNAVYTVAEVAGDTGTELSFAAWSLIIIYSSPSTLGHQLYLYDEFTYASFSSNVDFDHDGEPGGLISGFIVPPAILGEVNAAQLTVFLAEGDECYSGDSLRFNGTALSNAQSPWNNVWNSQSPGVSNDGIDIDTFDVTWASGLLESGDTSAQIDLPTAIDNWNIVYMIVSFRNEPTTGGSLSYVIR
jgi:hypothetical protein